MMKPRIKIMYLFVGLNYGGAETALLRNLQNLDKDNYEACVVSIERRGAIGEMIEAGSSEVIYLDETAMLFSARILKKIIAVIKEKKPDILQTSLFYANFYGRLATLFCRPKAVITEEHSMYTEKRWYHVLADRLLAPLANKIIVCSRSVLDFTAAQEKIDRSKFFLIYNAVDARRFDVAISKDEARKRCALAQNDFIVGTVGMVIPKKGHRFLVDAVSILKERIPELKVIIIGDGPDREGMERSVRSGGLDGRVLFLGERRDVPELMKAMDVFALPSLQEGFPMTILEAMYLGLPVIASNISGIPEIITDGVDGLLIPASDTAALAEKISALRNDAGSGIRYGAAARRKIESGYLPGHYKSRLEGLYRDLIKARA